MYSGSQMSQIETRNTSLVCLTWFEKSGAASISFNNQNDERETFVRGTEFVLNVPYWLPEGDIRLKDGIYVTAVKLDSHQVKQETQKGTCFSI